MPQAPPAKWRGWLDPASVVLLALPVFFLPLEERPVSSILEERVAITSREMWRKGEWIVPTMNGELRLQKPPLAYWLVQACAILRGKFDDETLRRPFALLSVGTALFVWATARRLFGPTAGLLTASSLITAALFVKEGRMATADSALFFCAAGAWHFYLVERLRLEQQAGGGRRPIEWNRLGFYAFFGLGALAKGPVILLLCAVPPLVEAAAIRSLAPLRPFNSPPGIVCFLGLSLLWPIAVIYRLSAESSSTNAIHQWWLESIGKVLPSSGVDAGYKFQRHPGDWDFYLPRLFPAFGAWSPALLWALAVGWRRKGVALVPWVGFLTTLVAFSLVSEKKMAYILPLLAPGALLVGSFISESYPRFHPRLRPALLWIVGLGGGGLLGFTVALALAPRLFDGIASRLDGLEGLHAIHAFAAKPAFLIAAAVVASGGLLTFAILLRRPSPLPAFLVLGATLSVDTWLYNELKQDLPNEDGDMRVSARAAAELLDPVSPVFCLGTLSAQAVGSMPAGLVYYLDRKVELVEEQKVLEAGRTELARVPSGAGLLTVEARIEKLGGASTRADGAPLALESGFRLSGLLEGFVVRGIVNPGAPGNRDRVYVLLRE